MRAAPRSLLLVLAAVLGAAGLARAQGAAPAPNAAAAAKPDAACIARAVEKIQSRYESVRDISADFVQTSRSVALGGPGAATSARGSVVFAKPGKMRWAYDEPEPSLVVSDGRTLWIYDPAHQEVQKLAVGDGFLSGAAIQFLLGEGKILRDFEVSADACSDAKVELVLVPKRDATYERLRVRSDPATGELLETSVVDLLGNVTTVAFSRTRTNVDPDAALFRFEPKPGVRLIELPPATGKSP